jgi:DNA-binding NtrC family response regulator
MNKISIVIVEDEDIIRITLSDELIEEGFYVVSFSNAKDCLKYVKSNSFDIIITDLKLPDINGLELLKILKENLPHIEMLVMTAYGSVDTAIEAMKIGAFNYLMKPFSTDELLVNIEKLIEFKNLRLRFNTINLTNQSKYSYDSYIGQSSFVVELRKILTYAANSNSSVLITGETGTGKELVANIIHYNSPRKEKPFVKVSCAILPRDMFESELFGHIKGSFTGAIKDRIGKIEEANGGTLFLDDIDDIPLELQVKLLRFLQEGEIQRIGSNKTIKLDIKVIAATKKNLLELSEKGLFREDLYYRLNVLPINLKPIRERLEDVPILFQHFVNIFAKTKIKIHQNIFDILKRYNWRGNIRGIKNIAERTVILSNYNTIELNNLPIEIIQNSEFSKFEYGTKSLNEYLAEIEIQLLKEALQKCENNKTRAAELLKIPLNTLRSKLEKYGIVE